MTQARTLWRNYALTSHLAGMLVDPPTPAKRRDIDVLWVSNIRRLKRPDRILDLAKRFPGLKIHMRGGALPGEEALCRTMSLPAGTLSKLRSTGRASLVQ